MISIVIVNYNGKAYIESCIDSVLESKYTDYEVIIVDNNSTDGSCNLIKQKYISKKIKVIELNENTFFTGGCNRGAEAALGEYLIFLNSDCVVTKNWLNELTKNLSRNTIAQPKILNYYQPDRIDNVGGKYIWPGIGFGIGHNQKDKVEYSRSKIVNFANATCLMIHKNLFNQLNGFDENYRFFYEDVDLCLRARKFHGICKVIPRAVIYHRGGESIKPNLKNQKDYIRKNRLRVINNNFSNVDRLVRLVTVSIINQLLKSLEYASIKS